MKTTPDPPSPAQGGDAPPAVTDLAQIRAVGDYLPQLVWSCLADGYCDYLSRRWVAYTGIPEEAHHGRGWLEAVHPDDREGIRRVWEGFVRGDDEYDVEYRLRRHDGEYLWFKARGVLVDDASGRPTRVLGTTTDVDAQKRAEEHVREIAERTSFVRQAVGVGFWYCDLPLGVLEWDERVKEHFFLPADAVVTIETFYERMHPDDREGTRQAIERCISNAEEYDVHYRAVDPATGQVKWIRAIGRCFPGHDGTPSRFDGISLDVTGQRQAESRATAILESISDAFYALDHEWRFTYVNGEAERLLDRRRDELVGRNIWTEFPPAVGTDFERFYHQAATERTAVTFEAYYPPLGHWYELNAYPSVDGISVYFREIDDRRAATVQLAEVAAANAKFRALFEQGVAYGALLTPDATVVEANRLSLEACGYTRSDVVGKLFWATPWWSGSSRSQEAIRDACARALEGEVYRGELPYFHADGSEWVAELTIAPVMGDEGQVLFLTATGSDITERKWAQERQRFLADLGAQTQRLSDPEQVSAITARLLAEHLGADRCAYAEVEEEATYVITGDYAREVPSIKGRWPIASFGAEHLRLMLADEPYVLDDTENDPRVSPEDLPAYRATAIGAVICVPLHKEGGLTAAMAVHQRTARVWKPEEVDLVRTVAGRCWEALERASAARRLRESEERFRAFMDYSPAAAWISDADGTVRYLSAAYTRLFQLPERELLGASPADIYSQEFAEEYVRNIRTVTESGKAIETVERAPRPDGTVGEFLVYKFPLPGGDLVGGVAIDITERRRAEEQLRDADRRKDEFLAVLAHELRNPLAPLRNGLEVMRLAGDDASAVGQARDMMERQLGHMVRLIDDLLDVSRISRNKMELRRERVLLADIVSSAIETARPQIDAAAHTLTVTLPPEPVFLHADLTRLAQVFSNLLTNAAKYTEPGGNISLRAEVQARQVVVSVEDTGIGIPPEALPTIFDMFSQIDRAVERATGGLGIGLSLVKGLVEMHDGQVKATSEGPGRGSTFTVSLPREPSPPAGADETQTQRRSDRRGPARRILVVDDNHDSATSMALLLRFLGHEIATAHDGAEAVEKATSFEPAVILMDVGLPKLNGYEATRQIRDLPGGKEITIIALTGWGQDTDRADSRAAGCDGHLVKPVDLADLLPYVDSPRAP